MTTTITHNTAVNTGCPIAKRAHDILLRAIKEKIMPPGNISHEMPDFRCSISLDIDKSLPVEGFRIEKYSDRSVRILGGSGAGILYGCGKLLRISEINEQKIILGGHPSVSQPAKSDRGMYFAVHNYNVYQVAPDSFIIKYIEDLALWGINDIAVVFHKFHFTGIDDSHTLEYIERLNLILRTAKSLGMKTTLIFTVNDGYLNSPMELRYKGQTPRNWGTEICVSQPAGNELIKKEFEEILEALAPLDQLVLWPYDSGGCECSDCAPWAQNGLLKIGRELQVIFKRRYPGGSVILSTWYFDYNCGKLGEWDSLFNNLENGANKWIDGILADGAYVNGYFPRQIVERPVNVPVISFMEISMLTGRPFGGMGSNPVPRFIQQQWNISKDRIVGGLPYSEGIYEDINKFIWAQLCWSPERPVMEILEEYSAGEFSREYAREIATALAALEPARMHNEKTLLTDFSDSIRVWEELSYYDRCLGWNSRNSWRWRHNLLRAKIDAEMALSRGKPTAEMGLAFDELFRLYQLNGLTFINIKPNEVVPDIEAGKRSLKFFENGKCFLDFCSYRKKAHEDVYDKNAETGK